MSETAKADDSITDVRASMEEVGTAAQPKADATSHLSYCDRGFRTTGDRRVDLARLGALCGPSNGLVRGWSASQPLHGHESGEYEEAELVWSRRFGPVGCGRFAVAFEVQGNERPLVVRVDGQPGLVAECRLSQSGFCPLNALVCEPERLTLRVVSLVSGDDTNDATDTSSAGLTEVNVEWWALPPSLRPRTTASEPGTRPLPSVE